MSAEEKRKRVALALSDLSMKAKSRWCKPGSLGCCCTGCANSRVLGAGLTEADWEDWMRNWFDSNTVVAERAFWESLLLEATGALAEVANADDLSETARRKKAQHHLDQINKALEGRQ